MVFPKRFVFRIKLMMQIFVISALLGGLFATSFSAWAAPARAISSYQATNDSSNVTYQLNYTSTYSFYRVYIDTDQNAGTGFQTTGIGANYLVENNNLYSSCGTGWCWTSVGTVTYTNSAGVARWTIARSAIGETANPNTADLLFQVESPLTTSAKYTHTYSSGGGPTPTRTRTPTPGGPTPTRTRTPTPGGGGGSTTVNYSASTAIITNPERGFLHTNTDCQSNMYSVGQLQGYRTNENISIVLCNFYLEGYQTTATLPQSLLNNLQTQFNTLRSAGVKVILRFSYSKTSGNDANRTTAIGHINQLAPVIQANTDVIALWQGSFIGQWGEGYYTNNYGNAGVISTQQWADRKAVYDAQLAALPTSRMITLRTPLMMTTMYGSTTVNASTAYNGSAVSRIGQHNDAFLASADDWGTYSNTSVQYPWLQAQSTYTAMGGESEYGDTTRVQCPTALQELAMFHWSYMNTDYNPSSIAAWTSGGCIPTMKQKLGYRFVLVQGTYPNTVAVGGGLNLQLSIRNDGYAAPFNPRGRELILRNTSNGTIYRFALTSDPRKWMPGTTTNINQTITLSGVPAGSYALLLNLHDPVSGLKPRPEYSIQTANTGTWEAGTGFNNLLKTVTVQ